MWAKLVQGKHYYLFGCHFERDIPQEVDQRTYDYLRNHSQFELGGELLHEESSRPRTMAAGTKATEPDQPEPKPSRKRRTASAKA
ncbi:YqbF domain-containing protein [Brevibacillus dissolubilis]|uniref:YqbF domain-containing protein n=1 Tax=Brevibacillus dissolubilis TaxID=1844116 RepID=UPI0011174441|nr:YqbF domain-containing protein [Brevibacillus dissolubilis]